MWLVSHKYTNWSSIIDINQLISSIIDFMDWKPQETINLYIYMYEFVLASNADALRDQHVIFLSHMGKKIRRRLEKQRKGSFKAHF